MNVGTRIALVLLAFPATISGQGFLEDFSYEGVWFSGVGLGVGGVISNRLETAVTGAARADFGMVAPRIRALLGVSYFKADFKASEIAKFEQNLRDLVDDPTGDFEIDIGAVSWSDIEAALDLQYIATLASGVTGFAGAGLGIHLRNGSGVAIKGTFVEDALDGIDASLDLSLGGQGRLLEDLYVTIDFRGVLSTDLLSIGGLGGLMYRIPR
ncbi:MAG: hypothetical protein JSW71_17770 [Gemmatimonadota bacterium]|nr:MAG: hypothetical protein JSW71_17770 [Gemmatimonadota bacterium]